MSSGDNFKYPSKNINNVESSERINGIKEPNPSEILLKLHKHPISTLYYALMESLYLFWTSITYALSHKKLIIALFSGLTFILFVSIFEGVHQNLFQEILRKVRWWAWWIFLGFLSSCGFGSGLHTFVLYLGPFIARVTMAAYECGSVNFLEPPYPNEFLCNKGSVTVEMSVFIIVRKVFLESIFWGLGTAIGELPPYFMARAAALSGSLGKDDNNCTSDESSWHSKAEDVIRIIVKRIGFVGIMLCASIPNPLFDLAGMTCGHFMVPFSTFFGATVIGKAFNKMLLQLLFVVIIFSKDKVVWIQSCVKQIPKYGNKLHSIIDNFLLQQKMKIHSSIVTDKEGWLQYLFGYFQMVIIAGFIVSIINSLADNYASRLRQWAVTYNQSIGNSKHKDH